MHLPAKQTHKQQQQQQNENDIKTSFCENTELQKCLYFHGSTAAIECKPKPVFFF